MCLAAPAIKKYVGVLKSRRFAEDVEEKAHRQKLYSLRRKTDAVDKIMCSAKFDDNPVDGLIYIEITLDAPAKLQPNSAQREKVRNATAVVANGYSEVLRNWIINQDTEKDSVPLRVRPKRGNESSKELRRSDCR